MFNSQTNPHNVAPGISDLAFIALLSWFSPGGIKPAGNPPGFGGFISEGDEVTIKQTHEFATGALGFLPLMLSPQKNNLTAKAIGELMGQQLAFEVKVFVPGSYIQQHSLMQQLLNKPIIALVKDCNCIEETYYQVGSSCKPAYLTHVFGTGTEKDGQKGYDVLLSALAESVIVYKGSVSKQLEYPDNGYPVFAVDEDMLYNEGTGENYTSLPINVFRSQFRKSKTYNITVIYNQVLLHQQQSVTITLVYRNSNDGSEVFVVLNAQDMSTFTKFINVLQSFLPSGTILSLYGTALLVTDSTTEEHYVGIQFPFGFLEP